MPLEFSNKEQIIQNMAEKKKKVTSAVMVVEYKVIKNRRGSIELSNGGLKPITDSGSIVELPDIKRSGTPRSDIIPSRHSSARRGSRQEEILKSMIDQLSTAGSSSIKAPTSIPTQLQNALLKHGPIPQKGRRMSVQERIVITKETPSRCSSANSKALLARRNTEPMLAFVHNAAATNNYVSNGSGLRSDGNTTNTTGSSSNVNGHDNFMHNKTEKDVEIIPPKEDDILEEEEEVDPNSPGVKLAIAKCRSWIQDLPEKFSGLNVLTFPDIQSTK